MDGNKKFRKIFVVQDFGKYDLVLLEKWGTIVVLGTKDYPTHSDGFPWVLKYIKGLINFKPDEDALLLVGDPILVGLSFSEVAAKNDKISCIKWSSSAKNYYSITVNL